MNTNCNIDVSVVIVNYNGKKYIDELFAALQNQTAENFIYEIVFVDNNSSDDSLKYIHQQWADKIKNLKIVEHKINSGFAGGNNLGVKESQGRYIVLLNNDTKPNKDWLQNLYNFFINKENIVIANSLLLFYYDYIKIEFHTKDKFVISNKIKINETEYIIDNKFCRNLLYNNDKLTCFGHSEIYIPLIDGIMDYNIEINKISGLEKDKVIVGEISRNFSSSININLSKEAILINKKTLVQNAGSGVNENYDGYDIGFTDEYDEKYMKPYQITNACGASMMMEKEKFMSAGGFDETFFMYYEDTDLSFRLRKNGGEIWYCPDSIVRHIHTGSSKEWSPFFIYHVTKNKLLFIYKNISKRVYMKYVIKQIASAVKEKNIPKLNGAVKTFCAKIG